MPPTAQPAARRRPTGHRPGRARPGRLLLLPLLLVLALLGLTACSSAMDTSEPGAGGADSAGQGEQGGEESLLEDQRGDAGDDGAAGDPQDASPGTVETDGPTPLMVRSVTMEVVVEDVLAAVSRARAAAVGVDGWVSSEEVRPGRGEGAGRTAGWATLVLRVPSEDLDAVVTGLGDLGEVTSSRSSAEDVTTEYRDVEARVATLEASTQRLRELVEDAGSVESIANLERELAAREADLDALKARMKVLAEDVSRSTVTLHLAEDEETLAETAPETGFLAGLQQGWEAFATSVTVLLTALGAVLPFALVAALVLVPLIVRRRRAGSRSPHPTAEAAGSD